MICSYNHKQIENGLWLVVDGSIQPINCKAVTVSQESSLDERYKFAQEVTFQTQHPILAIVQGTISAIYFLPTDWQYHVLPPELPFSCTYEYTITEEGESCTYTLSRNSNEPILTAKNVTLPQIADCGYQFDKVKTLLINDVRFSTISSSTVNYTNSGFSEIVFSQIEITESYEAGELSHEIAVSIPTANDNYLQLLEFLGNSYAVVLQTFGNRNLACGFKKGLELNFSLDADRDNYEVTLSFSDKSSLVDDTIQTVNAPASIATHTYVFTKKGSICTGRGEAQYLLQQELDVLGNPTGNYKCLEGHEAEFQYLTIVGTFDEIMIFALPECTVWEEELTSTIPSTVYLYGSKPVTYNVRGNVDWTLDTSYQDIVIEPWSGEAGFNMSVEISNSGGTTGNFSMTLSGSDTDTSFNIIALPPDAEYLEKSSILIDALEQRISILSYVPVKSLITYGDLVAYTVGDYIMADVTANAFTSARTYSIIAEFVDNVQITISVYQSGAVHEWVETNQTQCYLGDLYALEELYSGSTSDNLVPTGVFQLGQIVESGSTVCEGQWRRQYQTTDTYCLDGVSYYVVEDQLSYDDGETWQYAGNKTLGAVAGTCEAQTYEYQWVLSNHYECVDLELPPVKTIIYTPVDNYTIYCGGSDRLSRSDVSAYTAAATAITVGNCVLSLGEDIFSNFTQLVTVNLPSNYENLIPTNAFIYCTALQYITIPSGVTAIGNYAFAYCTSMTWLQLPANLTLIGQNAFYYCSSLIGNVEIPAGVVGIGAYAFDGVFGVEFIFQSSQPPVLETDALGTDYLSPILVPPAYVDTYKAAWPEYENRIQANV